MKKIGESELIITPEGRVYHINMRPEELARTVITVGDPDRVERVAKYFDKIEHENRHREFIFKTGRIGTKRITVLSSGIGPDNIDIVMNELDACANIDFELREEKKETVCLDIFRLGTSGSLQEHIPVDSMVCSAYGIGLDNVLHFYKPEYEEEEIKMARNFRLECGLDASSVIPYAVKGNHDLLHYFPSDFHKGITITCPGFYAPQGRVVKAALNFPDLVDGFSRFSHAGYPVTNFEMETSAIFGLGRVFGHRCLSINTIIANRVSKTFSKDASASVENMIQRSLQIISEIED